MEIPQNVKRFCKSCKKHTEQKSRREKVGATNRRTLAHDQRRMARKKAGYGSFPRPNPKGREKPTRKLDMRYKCSECNKEQTIGQGFRAKKFELIK